VVKTDDTVWCWGLNDQDQLGDNSGSDSAVPVQVVGAGGIGLLADIAVAGSGNSHNCAARTDDTVWCWGLNTDAQLGDNTTTNSPTPTQAHGV
jgi:alpha-tubulin suppressor-like RCC1 family protein